jgi:glucan phosphoethanolaminetransferase (alkaline phosphatase superfamily)
MKDFEHIMSVWQAQPANDQLSVDEALKQVKKGISGLSRKLMWGIIAMIVALVNSFAVLFFSVFQSWVTYVGLFIMVLTMLLYVLMMIRDYRIIHKRDATTSPAEYLQDLKEYQKNRAKLYGNLYYTYVMLLSIGLTLYFLEVLQDATVIGKIVVYTLTLTWFLICTFYLKQRIVKSEEEKINLIVERLERLKGQFEV